MCLLGVWTRTGKACIILTRGGIDMAGMTDREILELLGGYPHEVFYFADKPILHSGIYNKVNRAGIMINTSADFLVKCSYISIYTAS